MKTRTRPPLFTAKPGAWQREKVDEAETTARA
jgi:hypothetical protein